MTKVFVEQPLALPVSAKHKLQTFQLNVFYSADWPSGPSQSFSFKVPHYLWCCYLDILRESVCPVCRIFYFNLKMELDVWVFN